MLERGELQFVTAYICHCYDVQNGVPEAIYKPSRHKTVVLTKARSANFRVLISLRPLRCKTILGVINLSGISKKFGWDPIAIKFLFHCSKLPRLEARLLPMGLSAERKKIVIATIGK